MLELNTIPAKTYIVIITILHHTVQCLRSTVNM